MVLKLNINKVISLLLCLSVLIRSSLYAGGLKVMRDHQYSLVKLSGKKPGKTPGKTPGVGNLTRFIKGEVMSLPWLNLSLCVSLFVLFSNDEIVLYVFNKMGW